MRWLVVVAVCCAACSHKTTAPPAPQRPTPIVAEPLSARAYGAYLRGRTAMIEGRFDQARSNCTAA